VRLEGLDQTPSTCLRPHSGIDGASPAPAAADRLPGRGAEAGVLEAQAGAHQRCAGGGQEVGSYELGVVSPGFAFRNSKLFRVSCAPCPMPVLLSICRLRGSDSSRFGCAPMPLSTTRASLARTIREDGVFAHSRPQERVTRSCGFRRGAHTPRSRLTRANPERRPAGPLSKPTRADYSRSVREYSPG
jgi:hypothetical protein